MTRQPAAAEITRWASRALAALGGQYAEVLRLAGAELTRQRRTLNLVAASSPTLPAALIAQSLLFGSVTAEGYPGHRYHPGADVVDAVERLACERARHLFGADYANVQPMSGSAANLAVLYGVLDRDDTVLSLELDHGGHLSHVSSRSSIAKRVTGRHYVVDGSGHIDHDALTLLVKQLRPALVICGGSAYPRRLDFAAFRSAADEAGCLLMVDISHISGLVAAGVHPSPIAHADVVTTSTYKQLCGPRGGLLLAGAESRIPMRTLDWAVFPGFQGTPDFGAIAAKAVALSFAGRAEFAAAMGRVADYARLFAAAFLDRGVGLVSGGTDTHMVLVDLRAAAVSGRVVGDCLDRLGVLVNKNLVPDDPRPAGQTSGIRLGTNDLAFRPVWSSEVRALAGLVADVVADLATGAPADWVAEGRLGRAVADQVAEIGARGYREEWCQ
jgi:glycine hydroxymethyltransferase